MTKQDYDKIRRTIISAVYENGNYEITGSETQSAMLDMLGATENEGNEWRAETERMGILIRGNASKISENQKSIKANSGEIEKNSLAIEAQGVEITDIKNVVGQVDSELAKLLGRA